MKQLKYQLKFRKVTTIILGSLESNDSDDLKQDKLQLDSIFKE